MIEEIFSSLISLLLVLLVLLGLALRSHLIVALALLSVVVDKRLFVRIFLRQLRLVLFARLHPDANAYDGGDHGKDA